MSQVSHYRDRLRARSLLVSVVLDVEFSCFGGVVRRVLAMAMRKVGVMGRGLIIARLVVLGGFAMMSGRVLVMFGCLEMMLCCLF